MTVAEPDLGFGVRVVERASLLPTFPSGADQLFTLHAAIELMRIAAHQGACMPTMTQGVRLRSTAARSCCSQANCSESGPYST